MQVLLLKVASWLVQKLAVAVLIVAIALAAYGVWLFVQEEGMLEKSRVARMQQAITERDQLLTAKAAVEEKINAVRTDIERQKERVKQAEKIVSRLRELESWWDRVFGNPKQQTANAEQLQKMEELKSQATGKWVELQRSMKQVIWEKDGVEQALSRVNGQIGQLEASRSGVRHYVLLAWEKTKWFVLLALASFFFGPTLWAVMMYFAVAPFLSRGRPIQLGADSSLLPAVGESRVSVEAILQPGDTLRVKEKYLQASDEGIPKRTRFVLDWSIPFTSLACGLVELVEMQNTSVGSQYRVTMSNGQDPHLELAEVLLPAGSSLVLRPSFLAGIVQGAGEQLVIRRHWKLFRWQSWISGQFRFFEFVGPCRLMVAGSRGVRAEVLADREGQSAPARRTNQDATIGFTPNLKYRPVRAETFWSYYRGMNPLFDDLFAGRGLFVSQETASEGPAAKAGRFWSGLWNGVLKVFGM